MMPVSFTNRVSTPELDTNVEAAPNDSPTSVIKNIPTSVKLSMGSEKVSSYWSIFPLSFVSRVWALKSTGRALSTSVAWLAAMLLMFV